MKKQYIIYAILLTTAGKAIAQDTTATFLPTTQQKSRYDFFNRQVIAQPLSNEKQYSVIEAGYLHTKGPFMQRQDAPMKRTLYFNTEGTRQTGKWLVSGAFFFNRETKDSVNYTLQEGIPNANTYYFFSGSPGNWEINRYTLQGILSRSFMNNRLTLAAGGNYLTTNAWRSNDARTDQSDHSMNIDLALIIHAGKHHKIGISGGPGLDDMENSNEYRNKDYQNNQQYIERINHIVYGYGLNEPQHVNRSIVTDGPHWNVKGLYQAKLSSIGCFTLKGSLFKKKSSYFRKANSTDDARYNYGSFDESTYGWDGFWEGVASAKRQWMLTSSYIRTEGKDFQPILNGNNYVFHMESFNASPSYVHKKNGKPTYELWLNGVYNDHSRADGSANHFVRYKTFKTEIGGSGYWHLKESNVLKLTAATGIKRKLDAELKVPKSQEIEFSRQVVYYDYYFYTASVVNMNAEVAYYFPMKKVSAFGKFNFSQQRATLANKIIAASSMPGNQRTVWQFSLGFGM